MGNVTDESSRSNQKTHTMFNNYFSGNGAVYKIIHLHKHNSVLRNTYIACPVSWTVHQHTPQKTECFLTDCSELEDYMYRL
jgi:hypothetical protein